MRSARVAARRTARAALLTGVKAAAAAVDLVHRPPKGITILIYHRVGGGSGSQVDLPVTLFERQIAWLAERCDVITIDEALQRLASGSGAERRAVVVTFDDGTPDWVDHALPVLVRFGVPATFYVATAFVEDGREFPWGAPPISWAGLGELAASGLATVGSHTHSHLLLDRVDGPTAADELDRSVNLIGERLGVVPRHFAYPKALPGSFAAQVAVRERFASAVVAGGRANVAGADRWLLTRTPVQVSDAMTWFRRKAGGGLGLEGELRARVSGRRYEGAAT